MRETGPKGFQSEVMSDLREILGKDAILILTDPNQIMGIPDIVILYKDKWAALEVKASLKSKKQPLQDYYVDLMDDMSFAAFISPEVKEDVYRDLQHAFGLL